MGKRPVFDPNFKEGQEVKPAVEGKVIHPEIKGNMRRWRGPVSEDGTTPKNLRVAIDARAGKITTKMKKFALVWAKTGNKTEAALQSYDCKNRTIARSLGSDISENQQCRSFLESI